MFNGVLNWIVAATFYYLEAPGESQVLHWFRSLSDPPDELRVETFTVLHFRGIGELSFEEGTRRIDSAQSPVVTVFEPEIRRSALWSVGEVHFLTKHMRSRFAALSQVQKRFGAWLATNRVVWDQRNDDGNSSGYYLEGGVKNIAEKVYALPSGHAAYEAGRYFVGHQESEIALDRVCKSLRLRGVECG